MATEKDYQRAADWAEDTMKLAPHAPSSLHGTAAADFGRDLIERATAGRPSIDPAGRPGQHSPVRQVRLPAEVSNQLDALATTQHRRVSAVIRDAVTEYLSTHPHN